MFILCKDLIERAVQKYFREYRSKHKTVHPAAIKDYTTDMDFNNKTGELNKVEAFYTRKKESQLATVTNTSIIMCIVFASICFIGGIVSLVLNAGKEGNGLLVAMGFLFVLAVGLALGAVVNYFGNIKKRKNIVETTEKALDNAKRLVEALFTEHAQYIIMYDENDRLSDDIIFAVKR